MVKNYINNNEQESGRSMVEMLGVLAIIGVLSVGGISGYTTAMNKHKANEILNAAAVRAMAVSSQLQNGATTPTLDEFPNEEVGGATFDGVETIGDKFVIGFNLDSDAVLQQMKNIAGTDGIIRKITDGEITYNKDLSTDKTAGDYESQSTCEGDGHQGRTWCSDSETCVSGGTENCCPSATPANGAGGYAFTKGTTACYCAESGTIWNGTACMIKTGDKCNTYQDCDKGYYCAFTEASCNGSGDSCCSKGEGTCTAIEKRAPVKVSGLGSTLASVGSMNWYSADDWCKANNKSLVSATDFKCRNGAGTDSTADYCCDDNTCAANWDTEPPTLTGPYSSVMLSLIDKYPPTYIEDGGYWNYFYGWTSSPYDSDSENSCGAFRVGIGAGNVYGDDRSSNDDYYALCK